MMKDSKPLDVYNEKRKVFVQTPFILVNPSYSDGTRKRGDTLMSDVSSQAPAVKNSIESPLSENHNTVQISHVDVTHNTLVNFYPYLCALFKCV